MQTYTKPSFINFIYPFQFDPGSYARLKAGVELAAWQMDDKRSKKLWVAEEDLTKKEIDLLPHVANFLNPKDDTTPTAYSWKLHHDALVSPTYGLGAGSSLDSRISWYLVTRRGEIRFRIPEIRLFLFHNGVGFLVIEASPTSDSDQTSIWLDFLHHFRFAKGQREVSLRLTERVRTADEPDGSVPFFPAPAGGIKPKGKNYLSDILGALLTAIKPEAEWWKDVFIPGQLLSFSNLFVNEVPEDEISTLLYRVRNLFYASQPIFPAPEELSLKHTEILTYAQDKWFLFSLEGGAFISCNQPPGNSFFEVVLPGHLRNEYLLLYLLTLEQRFGLMMLSQEVASQWVTNGDTDELKRENAFEHIRDALLSFTARSYFTQVMQREHQNRYYQKWQEIFQVDRLYNEVRSEVNEMHQYLEAHRAARLQRLAEDQKRQLEDEARLNAENERLAQERTRRLERTLNSIAWLFGLPVLALTFLQVSGPDLKDWLPATVATIVFIGIGLIMLRVMRRRTNGQK